MPADRITRVLHAIRGEGLDSLLVVHPPNVRYLTGLAASAAALLVCRDGVHLMVDFRYSTAARALPGAGSIEVHVLGGQTDAGVAEVVRQAGGQRVAVEADHLTVARFNRLAALLSSAELPMDDRGAGPALVPVERVVERLRAVKDAGEIAILREAGRRLSSVAREAGSWLAPGRSERDVAQQIEARLRDEGFERAAFETIVASGPNGALPHARPTARVLGRGDGVVLDFGGVYDGYCVDLTRTLHIGTMPGQFRRLFEAVREAHGAALAAVKPGASPVDIDRAARRVLERHGLADAFGHGTGHGLGLEVHEEPKISPTAPANEPIVPGMVFTIEPGAYVPGIGGVRIEDDVLVTDNGCELLTDVPIDF